MTYFSQTIYNKLRITISFITIASLIGLTGPTRLHAQEQPTTTEPTTTQEPTQPTEEEKYTFEFNEATGLWENEFYTWNPITKQVAPKQPLDYSYNPDTGHWDTKDWQYDSTQGKYVESTKTFTEEEKETPEETYAGQENKEGYDEYAPKDGYDDNGEINVNKEANLEGNFDLFYDSRISNSLDSYAKSGDADVSYNALVGDITTGGATATANLLNMIWSSWNNLGISLMTFGANIMGDVFGDVVFNPYDLLNTNANINNQLNLDVNATVDNNALIENDIVLDANSGNANVNYNAQAGDVTTGDATALANIVNMINSAIISGQSFMGMINIYGNLDGDILLPDGLLDSIIASNAPGGSFDSSNILNAEVLAEFTNNQTINNNVDLSANTGNANVEGNALVGDVTTGDAETNLTILNLTGREIIGNNAFLVFVNVMGNWVGMIMNAPGATAAAIGGDITQNTQVDASLNLDVENTSTIDNDISLAATSGDANVEYNADVGDVTTGNASAAANIANIIGTQFNVTDWFGVLFINVFGDWFGSFGVDTLAGNLASAAAQVAQSNKSNKNIKVFALNTQDGSAYTATPICTATPACAAASNVDESEPKPTGALAYADPGNNTPATDKAQVAAATNKSQPWHLVATTALIGFALLGSERLMKNKSEEETVAANLAGTK